MNKQKISAREASLIAFNEIVNKGAYSNIILTKILNKYKISDLDRKLFTELTYGVTRAQKTLDWMISFYVKNFAGIENQALNILRLGFYQLFLMNKIPASAACNESVNLAKKYCNIGASKFINAVLRSAVRIPKKIKYPDKKNFTSKFLSLKYFHPEWLIEKWLNEFGFENTEKFCQFNNNPSFLSIRTNTLRITREKLLVKLNKQKQVAHESVWTPEGILIDYSISMANFEELKLGLAVIQDESSQLAAHILEPKPGQFIIDACAAPGGKSTHIAILMGNKGKVISCDIYDHKLKLLKQNTVLCGIDIIKPMLINSYNLGNKYENQVDKLLLDVPCSGLGILRKKADLRWNKNLDKIQHLPKLQFDMLNKASKVIKSGGEILYSTCTLEVDENENVIKKFLSVNNNFKVLNASKRLPCKQKSGNFIKMLPFEDRTDGFFFALLQKVE